MTSRLTTSTGTSFSDIRGMAMPATKSTQVVENNCRADLQRIITELKALRREVSMLTAIVSELRAHMPPKYQPPTSVSKKQSSGHVTYPALYD